MFDSIEAKEAALCEKFGTCNEPAARYEKIIELGRLATPLPTEHKTEANRVQGCQSRMYVHTRLENDKLVFETEADALISNGLGILLTAVYSGETAETILKHPPTYLERLGITAALSPSRANGLESLYRRLKQEALAQILRSSLSPARD